ncbi:hypothetical protein PT974_09352 [Cladobotryum mycophilum]|uniref:Uncharacterized protein n=1 Tax=Cladobotryum mycophilum TaxID=491253 RepID=A0ABR0SG20_9HYPO
MPRQGDGSGDNGPFDDTSNNILHGSTKDDNSKDKTAPLPEGIHEKGAGLEGMNASAGGGSIKQGPGVGQGGRGSSN